MNPNWNRTLEDGTHRLLEDGLTERGLELVQVSLYFDRTLENGTYRLLEDDFTGRALESLIIVIVPPVIPSLTHGDYRNQYTQNELPFLRCNVCNRKCYQIEYAGRICNAWNSAPGMYPLQYCPGILTPSLLATIPQLDFQLMIQERASK